MGKWRDKSLKGGDYFKIGLGLAAAGTGLGAAGLGPMAGLFGSGAAGAAGAAGVGGAASGVGGTAGGLAGLFGPAAGSLGAQLGGAAVTPMITGAGADALAGIGGLSMFGPGAEGASMLSALGGGSAASSPGLFSGANVGKALKGFNAFQQMAGGGQQVAPPPAPNRPFPNPADAGGSFVDAYRKKRPQPGDPDYLTWMLTNGNG